jgi:hypothetical protein
MTGRKTIINQSFIQSLKLFSDKIFYKEISYAIKNQDKLLIKCKNILHVFQSHVLLFDDKYPALIISDTKLPLVVK